MRELKEGGAVFCLFISSSWASCSYLQFLFHFFKHSFFILCCYFILFSTDLLSPGGLSSYRRTQRYCYVYSLRRNHSPVQSSSVQSLSRVWLFATPRTAACQASLSIINSRSLLKLMSTELVMPSNHLIFCSPLLLLPSIFPSTRFFSCFNWCTIVFWLFFFVSAFPTSLISNCLNLLFGTLRRSRRLKPLSCK